MKRNILISVDEGWANGSWQALEESGKVEIYRNLFDDCGPIHEFFIRLSKAPKLRRLPFKYLQILYANTVAKKLKLNKRDDVCIIVYHISTGYGFTVLYHTLKKQYSNVRLCYVFTNVISKCFSPSQEKYYMKKLISTFDRVCAFDRNDQKKYGVNFAYLVYNPVSNASSVNNYDVFLVAKAKDRLTKIMKVYHDLQDSGLNVEFYVNELSKEEYEKVKHEEIHPNQVLRYETVVEKIRQSKCIVDIMQQGSTGVTLNVCEAIVFGKKVISDNIDLVSEPFYDPRMIYILGTREDSIKDFVLSPSVGYDPNAKELFSGTLLFEKMRKIGKDL